MAVAVTVAEKGRETETETEREEGREAERVGGLYLLCGSSSMNNF